MVRRSQSTTFWTITNRDDARIGLLTIEGQGNNNRGTYLDAFGTLFECEEDSVESAVC